MGECIDFNWQIVDNTLSKRMIDNSLIHLWDKVQKKISKKTIIFNQKLKKMHMLKNYDQYIKVKTKIKEKLSNDTNEYESSSTEASSDEMNSNSIQDVEENIEKNEQSSQNGDEYDMLLKDKSKNSIPENDVPQLTNNEEKNESGIDDNSIEDSISNYDNDSILDNHSDMISDDEINKLVIDDNSTQELINSHDNDDVVENHSNMMNDDEENKLETHDNSTKNLITSPKNDNVTENHKKDTLCQKDRPTLKIIMTEIIKPKYTVIPNPQTIINPTEKLTHNQSSSDQLLGDNKSIELESSQRNNSPIQESNENNINNKNSIHSINSEDSIMMKQRVKKNKTTRIKRKNIIIKNDNQNSQSQCEKISDRMNDSDTNVETGKMSNIEKSKSQSPFSNEKAALKYTLEHMAYVKHRQERLNHESQFLNDSYINIENESREDSMEQENHLLQSNILTKRPMTLDEFVQENDLVPLNDKTSAFTLNDLSDDDDFFLMEMPKSVFNQELLGQKIVVRNFDMKIGSTNFKLRRLKNDTLTCIFKENNERMSFKAVNIKPKATFVVTEILAPTIDDKYFHQAFEITHGPCPFPQNLKIRNPLENNNKRLKKYKKKMRQMKKRKLN